MIYYVYGIRHEVFVEADSPKEALKIAENTVQEWEWPRVMAASWINGILTPEGSILLESEEE